MRGRFCFGLVAVLFFFTAASRDAAAGEIQLAAGPGAGASTWRGDTTAGSGLKLGYRMADWIAVDFLGRLGYATVDERMLTYVSLGATGYTRLAGTRPWLRLAVAHQHEESVSVVRDSPFSALFGVGDGIRHRGGLGMGLGVDVTVAKQERTEWIVGLDTSGAWFPDPRGPNLYWGGSLVVGLNYGL